MGFVKGLVAIATLATIVACSPLDSEASHGAVGVAPALGLPAIPAVAPLHHALDQGELPHMPADLATGQLAPHNQKRKHDNGQVGTEVGYNVQSHAKNQPVDPGERQLLPLATEEKALAPAPVSVPKLAIREVLERGIANIGARSDPPAQSFIQALGNMFSNLGNDKGKRDAPPALPAPPAPAPGALNVSSQPNNPDPAAGLPPAQQDHTPTPPAPALPAPVPAQAAVSPPDAQSPPASPSPAGSPPPSADPNSAPANLAAASSQAANSPPPANSPALSATPADAAAPPAAQALPASSANPSSNQSAAPPAVDTGASFSHPDSTVPHKFESVPTSPGVVAQDGHMGHSGPKSELFGAQPNRAYRHGPNIQGGQSFASQFRGGHRSSGQRTSYYRQNHQGLKHYGGYLAASSYHIPQGVPFDFQASPMSGPSTGAFITESGQQLTAQRHYYRNRRDNDFTPLPRTRRSLKALNRVHYRRDDSSASAETSDDTAEKKADISDIAAEGKPVKSDDTAKSTPAPNANTAESSGESKPKEKSETKIAEKKVDSKAAEKSKDDAAGKDADSTASEKSKTNSADEPAADKPNSKSNANEASTKSKVDAKEGKKIGSMPAGLDSSFGMGGAKDATPKKHDHHAPNAHKKGHHSAEAFSNSNGRKAKAKALVYKPRPKGHRTKAKSKRPAVSDHHSSRYNPHHKMIPQIARRYDLQVRNAAAEADAWADAYAQYLDERDAYAEYLAKREAYAYPEPWACSDPTACN
ncbi:hypothetical protein MMC34_004626 [Xylographa carneopallida]|nr:hypothetical protein [Xylographa carneopallida]